MGCLSLCCAPEECPITQLEQWQPPVTRHPIYLNKCLLCKKHSIPFASVEERSGFAQSQPEERVGEE